MNKPISDIPDGSEFLAGYYTQERDLQSAIKTLQFAAIVAIVVGLILISLPLGEIATLIGGLSCFIAVGLSLLCMLMAMELSFLRRTRDLFRSGK